MILKHLVLIAIGIANVSAADAAAVTTEDTQTNLRATNDNERELVDTIATADLDVSPADDMKLTDENKYDHEEQQVTTEEHGDRQLTYYTHYPDCDHRHSKCDCHDGKYNSHQNCRWANGNCYDATHCSGRGTQQWCENGIGGMACVWEKDWYGYYKCNTAPKPPDSCSERCEEHCETDHGSCNWSLVETKCCPKPKQECYAIDYPGLYDSDPTKKPRELIVKIKHNDLYAIMNDHTFEQEVPALFWEKSCKAWGKDDPIKIGIRKKKANGVGTKFSYKLNLNRYKGECKGVHHWHGVKKMSLENGDNQNVIAENLAWKLQEIAKDHGVYPWWYKPPKANLATLTFLVIPEGEDLHTYDGHVVEKPQGVYVNMEQIDKKFLINRNKYREDDTWLFKQSGSHLRDTKEEGTCSHQSPSVKALNCNPFVLEGDTSHLDNCSVWRVKNHVNVNVMMGNAATSAFTGTYHELIGGGHNMFWVDMAKEHECSKEGTRHYFNWDMDSAFNHGRVHSNIYGGDNKNLQQEYFFGKTFFLEKYNEDMSILASPTFIHKVKEYLYKLEHNDHLIAALEADTNNNGALDDNGAFVSIHKLRVFLHLRAEEVIKQLLLGP